MTKLQELENKYQEEQNRIRSTTIVPDLLLPPSVRQAITTVIGKTSPASLQLAPDTWLGLYKKTSGFSVAEVGKVIPLLLNITFEVFGGSEDEYMAFQKDANNLLVKSADLVNPELDKLDKEFMAKARLAKLEDSRNGNGQIIRAK